MVGKGLGRSDAILGCDVRYCCGRLVALWPCVSLWPVASISLWLGQTLAKPLIYPGQDWT